MTNRDGREPIELLGDFIADDPLYSWLDLEKWWDATSLYDPGRVINLLKVYRYCSHPRCRTERPFDRLPGAFRQVGDVFALAFTCTGCNDSVFQCWVQTDPEYASGSPGRRRIRKVGQVPPWDISVRADLRPAFGADVELYKSARECLGHSYGIAACAYLRRILENRITPLLQTLREIRQEQGASDQKLSQIDEAMRGKTAEQRIRLANEALPEAIKIAGVNPLADIYDRLSDALHRRNEQECIDVALKTSHLLEYVVTNLSAARRQQNERKAYEEELRALRNEAGSDTPTA